MDLNRSNRAMLMPPGELAGPLPRKVSLCPGSDAYLVTVILLVVIVFGGWFAASFSSEDIQQTRQRALLRENSREVAGQVKEILIGGRGDPDTVKYSFTVDGKTYFAEADEPQTRGPWDALRQSHPILIRFLPSNPAINHPAAWEWSALIYRDDIIYCLFWVTMCGIGVRYLLRERKLAREGRAAAGLVTSCMPNGRQFQVEYEFHTQEGESLTGKCNSDDSYEVGAGLWIIYLPQKPKRNHPYPLDDWIVVG